MAPLIGVSRCRHKTPSRSFLSLDWKREVISDSFTGLLRHRVPWEGVKGQALVSAGFMGLNLHTLAGGKWTQTEVTKGDPAQTRA
jgi:hypothetical protein